MTTDKPGKAAMEAFWRIYRELDELSETECAAIIQAAIDAANAELCADFEWEIEARHKAERERDEARAERDRAKEARIEYAEKVSAARDERDAARAAARELGESGRDLLKADDWLHAVAEEQDNHLTAISRKELEFYSAWNWAQWSGARGKVREALTKHAAYAPDSEKDGE